MNEEQFNELIRAIRAIAHGDEYRHTGLELVATALADQDGNVAESLDGIASAITDLATAVQQLGVVIDHHESFKRPTPPPIEEER